MKMFGGGGGSVKLPETPPPAPMPDLESPAILAAKRRALAARRGGVASTVLSGTDEYSTATLGVQ